MQHNQIRVTTCSLSSSNVTSLTEKSTLLSRYFTEKSRFFSPTSHFMYTSYQNKRSRPSYLWHSIMLLANAKEKMAYRFTFPMIITTKRQKYGQNGSMLKVPMTIWPIFADETRGQCILCFEVNGS